MAKEQPGLKTGCHVVLIDGEPLTPDVATLTAGSRKFRSSLKGFAAAAVRKQISPDEIRREVEAQISKIQAMGLNVTHVDSHKHTHIFPHVLRPLLQAAKACGVRAIRNAFEPWRCWPAPAVLATPQMWPRIFAVACFGTFARVFRRAVQEQGMATTDGTIAIAATGKLHLKMLLATLEALPEGTWELVCHPGYSDADLQASGTRLTQSREVELQALTSAEVKSLISRRGIELISYADLCS